METQSIHDSIESVYVYTIWDKLAEKPSPLFESTLDVLAIRQFDNFCRSIPYKDDYELIRVATWYPKTMTIKDAGNEIVKSGSDVKELRNG